MVEDQRAAIQDLEALKELNEELEENHVEAEKELQAEIDDREALIREQTHELDALRESNADYENTIRQFRDLVKNLQKYPFYTHHY
jgi:dynactin 1